MIKNWLYHPPNGSQLVYPYNVVLIAGYAYGEERGRAQNKLVKFVMYRLPMVVRNRRVVYQLVAARFGKEVRHESLAIEFKIKPYQIDRYANSIAECITEIFGRAEGIATDELRERGVID